MTYLKKYYEECGYQDRYITKLQGILSFEAVLKRPLLSAFDWSKFVNFYDLKYNSNNFIQEVYRGNFEVVENLFKSLVGEEKLIYSEIMFIYKKEFYEKLVKRRYKEIEEWL